MRRSTLHAIALALAGAACTTTAAAQSARTTTRTATPSGGIVATVAAARPAADSGAASSSVTRRVVPKKELTVHRERFSYDEAGRRDPFLSLIGSSELRPMVSDLRLAVVVYDPRGSSRAVLRDITAKDSKGQVVGPQYYNVRVGQQLGRMRVAAIGPKSVTFTILEFGESRQETLALNDSTSMRTTP